MKKGIFFTALIALALASCKKHESSNGFIIAKESYALLGDTLFPEGIAYNSNTGIFYTGSSSNGDIVRVNVETGETGLLASGVLQGRKVATGMKIDALNRLWVCGGADNKIQVLNLDGTLIKSWDTKALFNSGFINDCIIDDAYIILPTRK